MKIKLISGVILGLATITSVSATEYIYRDLMANTLPAHCDVESKSVEMATKSYKIKNYSKRFCQMQGYGWHLDEIKSAGNTVCTPCGDKGSLQQCHQEDVVVACKRIKPGTVGMLPGQG
ncbi:MAG: hypothetical protein ACU836_00980 [Gammaproteobacteria bacterium]